LPGRAGDRREPGTAERVAADLKGLEVDPLVEDVVRMLEEGVSPPVIVEWLGHTGYRPAQVTPDDLVALARAQAPDDVFEALLARAAAEPKK
jgi:hypothetical protein